MNKSNISQVPGPNEVCEGYVFTGVCLSTGGGICPIACWDTYPPWVDTPLGRHPFLCEIFLWVHHCFHLENLVNHKCLWTNCQGAVLRMSSHCSRVWLDGGPGKFSRNFTGESQWSGANKASQSWLGSRAHLTYYISYFNIKRFE